ncbi:hypothetical protein PAXRUDRAFT_824466 [Paxillus rubicundulus Ve08.2h10]|uniref:Uncharacterized protein n=1 Tax=Paxillus rubicundulus Ve08.2h10 TaxID=930991 RepID=A0A0D0E7R6_9AGAM|nr:hypothetical protein PAXRUDRAFT_824466 [Paxillus rubicundulus Ve08.2h10]
MSKGKGKQTETTALLPPLPNPSIGSANPSASLSSLWGYLLPALNHIVRSPTNSTEKAPAIDISYHMGIHTATYNYFTAQSEAANARPPNGMAADSGRDNGRQASGTDLYEHLDKYYMDLARELLLGAPEDDTTLVQYIIPCFKRYSVGAHSVNRLFNYVNRHYVKRAVDEDKGWLTLSDIFDAVAKSIEEGDTREKIAKKLKERKVEELKKWGYEEGSAESFAHAEQCAEAASSLDRVVPLSALALRRFRTEFIEPLMAAPKMKGKKRRPAAPLNEDKVHLPKGRLPRAVRELLQVQEMSSDGRRNLAADLAATLRAVGVRHAHPLRKKLEKFLTTGSA